MLRFFCTIKNKKQLASKLKEIAEADVEKLNLNDVKNLLTYSHQAYSKQLAAKQRNLYTKIINKLIDGEKMPELLELLQLQDGKLQTKTAIEASEQFLMRNLQKMNTYQKCLSAYWLSRYRHCRILNSLNNIYDEIDQIDNRLLSDEAKIMISYAQLMDADRQEIHLKTVDSDLLPRLQQQIRLYLSDQKATDHPFQDYRYRSTLETEVQCTLAALSLKSQRQVIVLNTYCVDFKCLDTYIDIHGPSHYLPWHTLKGSEIVRRRNLQKHNLRYKSVDYRQWSKLKGIRGQIAFMKTILNK